MCRYCSTLAELRKQDLFLYEKAVERFKRQFKQDDMLLRRCLIALSWKENEDLVNDILKVIGGDEECVECV